MAAEKKADNLVNITIGVIMIILNCLWLYRWLELLYGYHFSGKLYLFQYPNWILVMNIICALTGIFLAVRLIKKKISAWTALPANFGLFCICMLIQTLITS